MPIVAPVAVYRFFDADGALLYIGMTESPTARWKQHAADKPWWDQVADATVEWHDGAEAAACAELAAIRSEKPRHNIKGVPRPIEAVPVLVDCGQVDALLRSLAYWAAIDDAALDASLAAENMVHDLVTNAVLAGATDDQLAAAFGKHDFRDHMVWEVREAIQRKIRKEAREAKAARKAAREAKLAAEAQAS